MAELPARKVCTGPCKRWRPITDFRPRRWSEDQSRPIYVASDCYTCHAAKGRQNHTPKPVAKETLIKKAAAEQNAVAARVRFDEEFYIKHNKLPAYPFRQWLQHKVQELGIGNVASAVGVDPRRVGIICQGWHEKNGKRYPYNYVQLHTVDTYCLALGDEWWHVYPWLREMDRDAVLDRMATRRRRKPQ